MLWIIWARINNKTHYISSMCRILLLYFRLSTLPTVSRQTAATKTNILWQNQPYGVSLPKVSLLLWWDQKVNICWMCCFWSRAEWKSWVVLVCGCFVKGHTRPTCQDFAAKFNPGSSFVFQQGKEPKHTSMLCKSYSSLKQSDGVLPQMTWPLQSADLNLVGPE